MLSYSQDDKIIAIVSADKKIELEGEEVSVSKSAFTLLHREAYKCKQANGWAYWMKDGETLGERVDRFSKNDEEIN